MLTAHVPNMIAKIGEWVKRHGRDFWIALCVACAGWASFNLGLLNIKAHQPQTAGGVPATTRPAKGTAAPAPVIHQDMRVVVSKASSSKKYHFIWCSGVSRIKPENRIWFATEQLAVAAGYTLAGNCKP
jgi:hypothetical protein